MREWDWNHEGDKTTHVWAGTAPPYPRVVYYHQDLESDRGVWTVIDAHEGYFLPNAWEMPICM